MILPFMMVLYTIKTIWEIWKYENQKNSSHIVPKKTPPTPTILQFPFLAHDWNKRERAHVQLLPCPRAQKCQLNADLRKRAGQPAAATCLRWQFAKHVGHC